MALAAITVVTTTAVLATNGSFDAASIPVALILAAGAFAPLASLTGTFREVGQVSAAAERIEALMAAQPLVTDRVDERLGRSPARVGTAAPGAFEGVSFRYDEDLPDALADVAFAVEAGETGGARRATRARGSRRAPTCCLRLWDVREGAVTVGGTDVRDLTQRDLRSLIAVVPQDVYLFHASVAENLRLGDPDATDEAVRGPRSPRPTRSSSGCPTGTTPSRRARRVDLGRPAPAPRDRAGAPARDAPILVMDEAVANLDAESEAALQAAMAAVAGPDDAADRPPSLDDPDRGPGGRARPGLRRRGRSVRRADGRPRAARDAARRRARRIDPDTVSET